jgi:hypothetical protein
MSHKNVYRTLSEIYNLPYASQQDAELRRKCFSFFPIYRISFTFNLASECVHFEKFAWRIFQTIISENHYGVDAISNLNLCIISLRYSMCSRQTMEIVNRIFLSLDENDIYIKLLKCTFATQSITIQKVK